MGDLLDLGCGYGPIAITLALRSPAARVWAIDVNERALALCKENARRAGSENVRAVLPDQVPEHVHLASIYSNPPVRIGKAGLHELLTAWLDRLLPEGHAYLVVQRNLGADSLVRWLGERGHPVTRLRSRTGYRVLDVHASPDSNHHDSQ